MSMFLTDMNLYPYTLRKFYGQFNKAKVKLLEKALHEKRLLKKSLMENCVFCEVK